MNLKFSREELPDFLGWNDALPLKIPYFSSPACLSKVIEVKLKCCYICCGWFIGFDFNFLTIILGCKCTEFCNNVDHVVERSLAILSSPFFECFNNLMNKHCLRCALIVSRNHHFRYQHGVCFCCMLTRGM